MREHDLARPHAYAKVAQLSHQVLPERRVAKPAAVPEERADAGAHDFLVIFVQPHVGQPFHRRKTVAHRQRAGLGLQLLAHEPDNVHCPAQGVGFLAAPALGLSQYVITGTASRLDQTTGHQDFERGDHGVLGVLVQLGQLAQGRQLFTDPVSAFGDLPRYFISQALRNWRRPGRACG